MKRGLLLAAFCVTLILDMGGGPVFIVYASLHLNKNASFPAATWLLVRGIFNCIQFLTVMTLCYHVNRIKRLYSHKEENLVVGNLLATHPVSFFYYSVILGGIVWNTLGSGWITIAFRDYNHGFGVCYLVCIILSWVSVIISPTFVFCGGLVYKRKASIEPPHDDGGLLETLTPDEEIIFDVKKVFAQLQQEGVSLSVDEILWRDQFIQKDKPPSTPQTPREDLIPVVVTDIQHEESSRPHGNEVSVDDLRKDLQREVEEGVTRIISDVLDEESMQRNQEEERLLREMLMQQKAVILEEPSLLNEMTQCRTAASTSASSLVSTPAPALVLTPTPAPIPAPIPIPTSVSSTRLFSADVPHSPPHQEVASNSTGVRDTPHNTVSKKSRKRFSRKNQPKECVVSVDSLLPSISQHVDYSNVGSIQAMENYSQEYIDISQQMIQQINDGSFNKEPVNENVNVSYL